MDKKSKGNKRRTKGSGSVYYNEKIKKYVGQIVVGKTDAGNPKRVTFYGNSEAEVKKQVEEASKEQERLKEINAGKYFEGEEPTILELAFATLNDKKSTNFIKASSYSRTYDTLTFMGKHLDCCNKGISKVTRKDIQDGLSSIIDMSPSTIQKVYQCISSGYERAMIDGFANKNLIKTLHMPKSTLKPIKKRSFTIDEQKQLTQALLGYENQLYAVMYLLSLYTGMRMGEIRALKVSDLDFNSGIIHVERTITKDEDGRVIIGDATKTKAGTRDLVMTQEIKDMLTSYLNNYNKEKDDLVFASKKTGKFITEATMTENFKKVIAESGINVEDGTVTSLKIYKPHMLRRTYATRCMEASMQPKLVQYLMGHDDIRTTYNIYCTIDDEYKLSGVNSALEYLKNNKIDLNYQQNSEG